ncbi:MAG: hypothetical protein DDT20_00433 [Firmicutes bacterium]|nr:hypothetical protein [Bacillota bacterium]
MSKEERKSLWEARVAEYRASGQGASAWCAENKVISITRRELRWLLDGLSIKQRHAHMEVAARVVL